MSDRTIHARTANHWLIVRYDRAGKWYAEHADHPRQAITIDEAVAEACRLGSYVYAGKPGGRMFDAKVKNVMVERIRERECQ